MNETETETAAIGGDKIIRLDEAQLRDHLDRKITQSVEEALNKLLDAEADQLCGANRYERSPDRVDTRAGHYERKLHTKAGEVNLKVPKLRSLPFETQLIERYRRRESSVEEALMEMYLTGVSVRRVEDITEALWGVKVGPSTVSDLNQKIYAQIEEWRNLPIQGKHAYVYLDGLWLKRSWGGTVKNVSVLVAVGVNQDGYREILGVAEGTKEDKASWQNFLRWLKERGLQGVQLVVSDKCLGLVESLGEFFPDAAWQRCAVHFYRNVWTAVPSGRVKEVAAMLKAIHACEDLDAAREKAAAVVIKLRTMKLPKAAEMVDDGIEETLCYMAFPREHWRSLRTNNPLERLIREVKRRTRVVGAFPDGNSALMLVAARLRYMTGTKWGMRRYLDMSRLTNQATANPQEANAS
ncbi:IS256 family transposase [Cerasicoccus arenae]|uniref:IS256 family transposase n=4 Tax=Cerasicoccus arenae TaxID=424488 RepID=UPI0019085E1C|nr:IS256 family transposase [Cerasicoccus arenae]MBK1860105.1 IS256 family transposase [Cerasicoccus arenae]